MDNKNYQELINILRMIQKLLEKVNYEIEKQSSLDPFMTHEIEIHFSREESNCNTSRKESTSFNNTAELESFEEIYSACGYITCWDNDKYESLNILSKDLQRRATMHLEYTYVIDMGTGRKRFKAKNKALEYLAENGLILKKS